MSGKIKKREMLLFFFSRQHHDIYNFIILFCPHSRPLPLSFFTLLPFSFFFAFILCLPHLSIILFSTLEFFFASKWVLTAENLLIEKKILLEIKSQMIEKKRTLFHHGLTTTPGRPDLSCSAQDPMNNATAGTSFMERARSPISDLTGTEHGGSEPRKPEDKAPTMRELATPKSVMR